MKKVISILLAVGLLVCCATVFVLADEGVITREEFFNSIVKVLGFEKAESMSKSFSDTEKIDPEFYGNIAAGVNHGLFLGKTDGTLGPKDVLTVEDMEYVLSRIDFTPKTVTKYVSGGTKVVEKVVEVPVEVEKIVEKIVEVPVEVEKIVEVPVPQGCDEENGNHFFELNEIGLYECVCGKYKAPAGTVPLHLVDEPYEFTKSELETTTPVDMFFYAADGSVCIEDYIYVGKNAKLFELVDGELVPIGFIELFAKYALETEDGSVLFPAYYHLDGDNTEEMVIDGLVVVN